MKKAFIFGVLGAVFLAGSAGSALASYTYTTVDYPGAWQTEIQGVIGDTLVGTYTDTYGNSSGFTETGGVFTRFPLDGNVSIAGVSGSTIVGNAGQAGFIESGGHYTTIYDPLTTQSYGTRATGMSGDTVVGYYYGGGAPKGFTESGGVYTTLIDPKSVGGTFPLGISGNTIVGIYYDAQSAQRAFSETNGVFTDLGDGVASDYFYTANGVSGDSIVGVVLGAGGAQGFVETNGVYTLLDVPFAGASGTTPDGIYGTTIVGHYGIGTDRHGFVATLDPGSSEARDAAFVGAPEPASLGVVGFGGLCLIVRRRRR